MPISADTLAEKRLPRRKGAGAPGRRRGPATGCIRSHLGQITMEIRRHPDHLEFKLPEFFDLDPRVDNFSRIFTAVQPGVGNLLLDLSGRGCALRKRDDTEIAYFCRSLASAFAGMTDMVDFIAILARPDDAPHVEPYVRHLEQAGYVAKLFTDRAKALGWIRPEAV